MEITQKIKWYKKVTILLTISTIVPTALLMMSLAPAGDEKSRPVSQSEARANISNYRNSNEAAESGINGLMWPEQIPTPQPIVCIMQRTLLVLLYPL